MSPSSRRAALAAPLLAALLAAGCETAGAARGGAAAGGAGGTAGTSAVAPEPPTAVLARFVGALEGGRWADAQALLSARWRAAYTPGRLAADYAGAGPLAREAAARVRAALGAGAALEVGDGRAILPVAGGRALLVAEAAGWRVEALE